MALNGNGGIDATMLVQPGTMPNYGNMGGGFGFGNDFATWVILLLVLGGGWGGFGGFGMGGYGAMMGMGMMGMDYLYPWLNNSQNINNGFRDQQISTQINGIQSGIQGLSQQLCQCCGDMRYDMANGFNGVSNSIFGAQTAIGQQLYSNEIANLNRSFAEQTANAQGFNGVNAGVADLRYTVATEACADRAAVGDALQNVTMQNMGNTNVIVSAIRDGIQSIKDDLCADRLDAERRENQALRTQLSMAQLAASQVDQTAQLRASQAATANQLVAELRSCPIPSQPVYGNQPIFTCPQQASPCNCNGNF
jgi:hypothetical protein